MISIFIPYRNRKEQLDIFIPHMLKYLPNAKIYVCQQVDDKPFNRGKLFNILYLETKLDYFVCHDVDMLPLDVNYSYGSIAQLASSDIQKIDYLGGVTLFLGDTFEKIGGYHNDYFHRAEDNELMFNIKRLGFFVMPRFGKFKRLEHERTGPEFIEELWIKAQQKREIQNQLSICKYNLISKEQMDGYTLIKVEL